MDAAAEVEDLLVLREAPRAVERGESHLGVHPTDPETHAALACAFVALGRPDRAGLHAARALEHGPPSPARLHSMVRLLSSMALPQDPRMLEHLRGLLERTDVDVDALSPSITRVLLADPRTWADLASGADIPGWATDPLVLTWLSRALVADERVEGWLVRMRSALLAEFVHAGTLTDPHLQLSCALARQAFLAEYVWQEDQADGPLRMEVAQRAGRNPTDAAAWMVEAMFTPLHAHPRASALLHTESTPPVASVLAQQWHQHAEEAAIRQAMTQHGTAPDQVSHAVRTQYEENPYPRWSTCPVPRATTPAAYLQELFPGFEGHPALAMQPWLLVAGCGTGRHALLLRRRFPTARLLGLDLSLTSLAHARRLAHRLSVFLDLQQADLLDLRGLQPSFHMVECVGVLHHMRDPADGLAAVVDMTVKGGVICLGVYSRAGRRGVNAARRMLSHAHLDASPEGIRQGRMLILDLLPDHPARSVTQSPDFHSTSGCRDLLFHAQEHQFDLPEVAALVARFPLRVLGLEPPTDAVAHAYDARFGADPWRRRLDHWEAMESDDPDLFAGMYVIWCQRT